MGYWAPRAPVHPGTRPGHPGTRAGCAAPGHPGRPRSSLAPSKKRRERDILDHVPDAQTADKGKGYRDEVSEGSVCEV